MFFFLSAFLLILLIDLKKLIENRKNYKVLSIYIFLFLSGFITGYLQLTGNTPVSPARIIEKILDIVLGR